MTRREERTLIVDTCLGSFVLSYRKEGLVGVELPKGFISSGLEGKERNEPMPLPRQGASPSDGGDDSSSPLVPSFTPTWVRKLANRLARHVEGKPQDFLDVPVLYNSTPFAVAVYEELRKVRPGVTVTYGELAKRIGCPSSVRAVARAVANNRWPMVVPCHRVLRADGTLGGFSGGDGLVTKCVLLRAESIRAALPKGVGINGSLFQPFLFDVALESLRANDAAFRKLYDQVGYTTLPREYPDNPFAALVEAVCYQQLAGNAAAAIFSKVCVLLSKVTPESVTTAGEAKLHSAGLSASKAQTILELAARARSGKIRFDQLHLLEYDKLLDTLGAVKGIGPWTVQMFAIFHLGLPDIFPSGDYGIRKAVTTLVGSRELLSAKATESIGERWKPFRTVAAWYLWKSLGTVTIGGS